MFIPSLKMPHLLGIGASVMLTLFAALPGQAQVQIAPALPVITAAQLKMLLPDENDLQGFVRIRPAFDTPERIKAQPIPDIIIVNKTSHSPSGRTNTTTGIARALYSQDEIYLINMSLRLYDSAATAHYELTSFRERAQTAYRLLAADPSADDETWLNDTGLVTGIVPSCVLLFRRGRTTVIVQGSLTMRAENEGGHQPLSAESVLAIGNMIDLRLARQALFARAPAKAALVAVNGTELPAQAALLVGKQLYVPVTEFAKAAGWTSQWNVTTGRLTLTSPTQQQITLAAGSTAVKQGDTAAPALKCPVLKEANQPVMVLSDLLTLTKGRITEQQGNSFKVAV